MIYVELLLKLLIIIGSLNYLTSSVVNINIFKKITENHYILRFISILIGLSGLYFAFNRDFYLPFLGPTVIPVTLATKKVDNLINVQLKNLPPNTKVIYWAAISTNVSTNDPIGDPITAYKDYTNSGMAISSSNGDLTVQIECPSKYNVSKFKVFTKTLPKHIHYRYELPEYPGMFSKVFTQIVDC